MTKERLKLYLVEQSEVAGYETYDSFVCVAKNEKEARLRLPGDGKRNISISKSDKSWMDWVGLDKIDKIKVTFLGYSKKELDEENICSSFNSG